MQRWNINPGDSIEQGLRDLLLSEGRVLIVLSEWYFRLGPRTHDEWNTALRAVVPPHGDRFAAVAVTSAALPGAVASLGAADLWGLGAAEAERRLLARLGITPSAAPSATPSAAPTAPASRWNSPPSGAAYRAATPASPAASNCSTNSTSSSARPNPAPPSPPCTACPASGRRTSPRSTSTASAPSTTWCGG